MEITWLGYSCFRLKGSTATVITDPCPPELGYSLGKQAARIVTVSHQHPGHSYVQGIGEAPKVIASPGEYEIGNTLVIGVPTFHDKENGHQFGKNTVFVIEMDDLTICHLGDLGHPLTSQQVEDAGNIDLLLVPVGGVSALNGSGAAEVVRQLEPKVVVPMHYRTPALKKELEPVDRFLKEMGVKDATPRPKLSLTRSSLPENTQVLVLEC